MITLLEWVFFETVVGIALIGALIYRIARVLKALFPGFPNPALIALPSALLALFTVPSILRYQFEARVLHEINGKPWLRVTNQTRWGALAEPLTWFRTPIGSVTAVIPDDAMGSEGFREIINRYDEKPIVSLVDPDCTDRTILYARPDKAGVFRYATERPEAMSESERSAYCGHDWSRERTALREEILRKIQKGK